MTQTNPVVENFLAHYGVLGMHWGIRRYQPYPDGTTRKQRDKSLPKSQKQQTREAVERAHSMSNQQLKEENERLRYINENLQLQRRYADLTTPQKTAGRQYVEGILKDYGRETAKYYLSKGTKRAVGAGAAYATSKWK